MNHVCGKNTFFEAFFASKKIETKSLTLVGTPKIFGYKIFPY